VAIASTEEQRAIQAAIRRWSTDAAVVAAVRDREGQAARLDRSLWTGITDLGLFSLAVPEKAGGTGNAATDLAAALEQVTDALVPGPILPTVLASLVLATHAELPTVAELLPEIAAGRAAVAVAFASGSMTATRLGATEMRVSGKAGPVLGAGETSHLLLAADTPTGQVWFLVTADQPGVRVTSRPAVDFSRALADIELSDVVVEADRLIDPHPYGVRDTAAFLCAVEAVAVAGWCLLTATEYAKTRRQFGREIGSFQAVKHLCAGMLCRAERAAAVAWDAAVAFDKAPDEFPLAAAAAAAVALDAGVDNAKDCVQVLGGIGFTWEHDAHLYLRRAVALRQLLGGSARWRERVADLALGGARRGLRAVAGVEGETERPAVRAKAGEIAALPVERQRAALADAGYLAPGWPVPYGLDASPAHQLVIDEELTRLGVQRPDLAIAGWAVPTILQHGTAAQRDRFAAPSLRGEIIWCQLFSEPEAGSDLAALRTRAVRADGGWRLSGQKVWTSLARQADWAICLARTDPDAPKHRGMSYFLVAMDTPGIDIRPLREITGDAVFNEVFLDDVFVPDECLVGAPGDGWRLARGTLEHERVAIGRGSSFGDGVEKLIAVVGSTGIVDEPGVRDRLGALVADGLAVSILDLRATLQQIAGEPSSNSAVRKLVGVGQRQAVAEAALQFCGLDGASADGPAAEAVHQFLLTRCLSIAGGTTQILLTLVAERVLGLPREEVRAGAVPARRDAAGDRPGGR